ncbi:hypothetical protein C8R43DRAFT_640700 [Mycena crocata]|nr:hypothetical protein C8R43DRAFT_640700 [Mycena crocata]
MLALEVAIERFIGGVALISFLTSCSPSPCCTSPSCASPSCASASSAFWLTLSCSSARAAWSAAKLRSRSKSSTLPRRTAACASVRMGASRTGTRARRRHSFTSCGGGELASS